jgi:Skp family chaperone for outer membrane proteins
MNRFRQLVPALVVMTLGAVIVLARPGSTASGRGDALPVGYVDMPEVADKSVVGQETQKQAKTLQTRLQDELEKKQQIAYLTTEQRSELEKLEAKADKDKTDPDKARIAELKGTTAKMEQELLALQQKTNPSAADGDRIKELTKKRQEAIDRFENDKGTAQNELDQQAEALIKSLNDKITKAVEDVAQQKGLAMVVHKEARVFGGVDITDAVIGRLKK